MSCIWAAGWTPVLPAGPGPGVHWYDIDYPDVAELRQQLYTARDHYHVIAASVTDPGWIAESRATARR